MAQARCRSRNARQDRYLSEVTGFSQKTKDDMKCLKDEAMQNKARPGDAAWVKAIFKEDDDFKKCFSKGAMENVYLQPEMLFIELLIELLLGRSPFNCAVRFKSISLLPALKIQRPVHEKLPKGVWFH